ncbi:MAG TPA: HAD family phosphatase [Candidatus Limnocylindria bacterium]|nr:HAD family phosphatase [Candidatus Limnocylindria bacterium]
MNADSAPRTRPLAPPKAVVFDLGKVLLDFDYHIAARTLAPHSDLPAAEFKRIVDQSPLLHRYESGQLTTAEFGAEVRRLTGFRGSDELFHGSFGDIFAEIPEMVALQRRLAGRGVPTYVFSNTNELAIGHIRRQFPFFGGFTGYIYSYEVRSMKPDPGIYVALETLTGLSGADLLYLDDRAENIAHGAERGWRTILHADHGPSVRAVSEAFGW